jgi:DNA-binding NtrC family response regulator
MRDSVRSLYPKVPAILISAFYDRDIPNVDQAEISQQFVFNLTKPFDVDKLQNAVLNIFNQSPVH